MDGMVEHRPDMTVITPSTELEPSFMERMGAAYAIGKARAGSRSSAAQITPAVVAHRHSYDDIHGKRDGRPGMVILYGVCSCGVKQGIEYGQREAMALLYRKLKGNRT